MMKQTISIAFAAIFLFANGCKGLPKSGIPKPLTREEFARSDVGPPPANYRQKIKVFFNPTLLDPKTAIYDFDPPSAEKVWTGLIWGGYKHFWVVHFRLKTKRPEGTFTGPRPCLAGFDRKGEVGLVIATNEAGGRTLYSKKF